MFRKADQSRNDQVVGDLSRAQADDRMVVSAARWLLHRACNEPLVCFVGIGMPSIAANLAVRLSESPLVLVYESGCLGAKPSTLPLSIGDGELATSADSVVSVPEIFAYWLQGGRIDVGFLGAAQIDRWGDLNSTVIGPYDEPVVRLPGCGGAPAIASSAGETAVIIRMSRQSFVERCDFVSTQGLPLTDSFARLGPAGSPRGITRVFTDVGFLEMRQGGLTLTGIFQGLTVNDVQERSGWTLDVDLALETIPDPTPRELAMLTSLRAR